MPLIQVIEFGGYYFIWNGNYEMIAANMVGKLQVDVEIIPLEQQNSWLSEEGIEEQLKTVGMNALYDFEALGGFKYPEYPVFYKGENNQYVYCTNGRFTHRFVFTDNARRKSSF